ncbi:hypothetical protein CFC21_015870 [Triticum aestivum]|uniref:Cytochrome P450 n=3 Tax=Triticum aestivum TaxID=4565 RepID=A0A3B6ATW6_WHEAT|nr:hypothetical protein CFC21_015870 [Triticum aestivum]
MTMATVATAWTVWAALASAVLASCLFNALVRLVWRPRAIAGRLARQGVRGPGYRFFVGNLGDIRRLRAAGAGLVLDVSSHDFIPISQPQFRQWIPLYGRVFLYWFGSTPNMCVADLGMAKQLLSDRTGLFPKNWMNPIVRLVGKGLVMTDGDVWHRHKKVLHPAFNVDKLKVMTSTMVDCVLSMASRWEAQLASHGKKDCQEIELTSQFEELTADVISRTAFGSSYREGRKIFLALNEIQLIAFSTLWTDYIPGFRFVPTKKNMRLWKLNKMMRSTLVEIIENRLAAKDTDGYGSDLLGLMLEACAPEQGQAPLLSMDEIIDECKTFFFAGQETSLHMLNWTMFLLGTHPEWQRKLREEVLRECGGDHQVPTYDTLSRLRLVNLFLLETLRLYSPVPLIRRRTRSEVELGGVTVPRDALLTIPIATMHRDREVWGEDADEFNPMRFDAGGGGAAASHANALLSFSMGPRTCIGQNFAMVQAKAEVAVILRRFALSLSPSYVHAPTDVITLRPKYGLPMIITRLDA